MIADPPSFFLEEEEERGHWGGDSKERRADKNRQFTRPPETLPRCTELKKDAQLDPNGDTRTDGCDPEVSPRSLVAGSSGEKKEKGRPNDGKDLPELSAPQLPGRPLFPKRPPITRATRPPRGESRSQLLLVLLRPGESRPQLL